METILHHLNITRDSVSHLCCCIPLGHPKINIGHGVWKTFSDEWKQSCTTPLLDNID